MPNKIPNSKDATTRGISNLVTLFRKVVMLASVILNFIIFFKLGRVLPLPINDR